MEMTVQKANFCDAGGIDNNVAEDSDILGCLTVSTTFLSITRHTILMKVNELDDSFSTHEIYKILVLGKSWNISLQLRIYY
jgi:hypothetical protein